MSCYWSTLFDYKRKMVACEAGYEFVNNNNNLSKWVCFRDHRAFKESKRTTKNEMI